MHRWSAGMGIQKSLLTAMAFAAGVGLGPTAMAGQAHTDSAAVMRSLGTALRGEARAVLTSFACHDGMHPCPTVRQDTANTLLVELARAARASLVPEAEGAVPPCPWGYDPPRSDAGFLVGIAYLRVRGDTAHVLVVKHCDNPLGYLHDVFGRDDDYRLVRAPGGQWRVIRKELIRITRRAGRSAASAPGT